MVKKVIIVEREAYLQKVLSRLKSVENLRRGFFTWHILPDGRLNQLRNAGFLRINRPAFSEDFKSVFIDAYADLIVAITGQNNDRVWLASDAASKNRFSSPLPFLLEKFILIKTMIEQEELDELIIVGQPWATWDTLKDCFIAKGISFEFHGSELTHRLQLFVGHIRKIAAAVNNGIKVYLRGHQARRVLAEKIRQLSGKQLDYIIKTFLYDHSSPKNENYHDAFFGRLPAFLKGRKDFLVLANVLGRYQACLDDFSRCRSYVIIPYEAYVSLNDIVRSFWSVLVHRMKISPDIRFLGNDICSILQRIVLDKAQFHQMLHFEATKNLLASTTAKAFLTTYENYPWERMCILAIRQFAPSMKIIGYQHTVVPQAFLNMFIGRTERGVMPLPDKIITTGGVSKDIIEQYSECEPIELEAGCGLRFEYLFQPRENYKRKKVEHILVALEIGYEQFEIVRRLLEDLSGDQRFKVRIRAHPNFPWSRYEKRFSFNLKNYPYVSDSGRHTLKDDLQWADVVIYSGTTVGLEGLMMGKPIIHFDRGAILSFDPLFQCHDLKWTVAPADSFKNVLNAIEAMSEEEFVQQQQQAQQYTRRYFYPTNEENLQKFSG